MSGFSLLHNSDGTLFVEVDKGSTDKNLCIDESDILGLISLLRTLASFACSKSLALLAGKTVGFSLSLNRACLTNRTESHRTVAKLEGNFFDLLIRFLAR